MPHYRNSKINNRKFRRFFQQYTILGIELLTFVLVCISLLRFAYLYYIAYSGGYPFSISGDIRSVPS